MGLNISQQGIVKASGETVNGNMLEYITKSSNTTTYNAYQFNLTERLTANTTYTIQFWDVDVSHSAKTEDQLNVSVYMGGGSKVLCRWQGTDYFTNGHADYLAITFTLTSSQASHSDNANLWLNIYNSTPGVSGTMNMHIGKWKMEKGSVATPWIPASTDPIYVGDSCGFTEIGTTQCSFGQNYVITNELIEI